MEDRIARYLELLRRYGAVADLSSARVLADPARLLEAARAYAEVLPQGALVLDLGSGAGWPGIPLAILRPDLELTLAERRRKRAAFLELAAGRLGLEHVRVHAGDVGELAGPYPFVTAQAVGSFPEVYRIVAPLLADPAVLVSVKGPGWEAEVAELPGRVFHVKPLGEGGTLVAVEVGKR